MNNKTEIPLKVKIEKKDIYNICNYSDKMRGNAYKLVYKFLDDDYNKVLFESRVQGIQNSYYKCRITMYNKEIKNKNDIISWNCSCPIGSSCKHITETILAISSRIDNFKEKKNIEKVLELKSKEEIIIAIKNICKYNDDIEIDLLKEFNIFEDEEEDYYEDYNYY
jgi:hypothetical protein